MVHITDAVIQHNSTEMVSRSALQNRRLHTTYIERSKTL